MQPKILEKVRVFSQTLRVVSGEMALDRVAAGRSMADPE